MRQYVSRRNHIDEAEAEGLLKFLISEITSELCASKNVFLSGLGSLELKTIPGRTTVLFTFSPEDSIIKGDNFLQIPEIIRELLEGGETVKLAGIGLFEPRLDENGFCSRVCFTLYSTLRSALNAPKEEIVSVSQPGNPSLVPGEKKTKKSHDTQQTVFVSKDVELLSSDKMESYPEKPRFSFFMNKRIKLVLLCLFALVFVLLFFPLFHSDSDMHILEDSLVQDNNTSAGSLLEFSTKHYGHPSYWVYLYDYNRDRLPSFFADVEEYALVFPDLKTDYHVDLSDSLEIVRANLFAEELLNNTK